MNKNQFIKTQLKIKVILITTKPVKVHTAIRFFVLVKSYREKKKVKSLKLP